MLIGLQKLYHFYWYPYLFMWWLQVDVPGWPEPVYTNQLILCLRCCAHRSQHLCSGRPGHRSVRQQHSADGLTGTYVFESETLVFSLCTGTSFDYIREFRRSTGTWHRTKPMLPSDLSKTACAALRIANCRLFRLQWSQGMFRVRVWVHFCTLVFSTCSRFMLRNFMNTKVL